MNKSEFTPMLFLNPVLIAFSSLIVPGLGQFLLKKRQRGFLIFVAAGLSTYLIDWSLVHQNIAKVNLGGWTTSWRCLPGPFGHRVIMLLFGVVSGRHGRGPPT